MKKKQIIAGVDEVGRGCLAGPVISAAVILKEGINLNLLKDSKKISFKKRQEISDHIKSYSFYSIGLASVDEILDLNILQASLLSMKRALEQLAVKPDVTLIDGNFVPSGLKNCKTIINGDEKIKDGYTHYHFYDPNTNEFTGKYLKVKRLDRPTGWGQELIIFVRQKICQK